MFKYNCSEFSMTQNIHLSVELNMDFIVKTFHSCVVHSRWCFAATTTPCAANATTKEANKLDNKLGKILSTE